MTHARSTTERLRFEVDPDAPPSDFDAALARFLLTFIRAQQDDSDSVATSSGSNAP